MCANPNAVSSGMMTAKRPAAINIAGPNVFVLVTIATSMTMQQRPP